MATIRPYQNMSDADLDKAIAHNLINMDQAAQISSSQYLNINSILQNQFDSLPGIATSGSTPLLQQQYIDIANTTVAGFQMQYDAMNGAGVLQYIYNDGSSVQDQENEFSPKVNRIFNKLHKKVEQELALA